jgi:putative transferase (TIGR04331 family)
MNDDIVNLIACSKWDDAVSLATKKAESQDLSSPEVINIVACLMLRERRMSMAKALFEEAARLGNREAARNIDVLGWKQVDDDNALFTENISSGICFLPSSIARRKLAESNSYLVPDYFTSLSLKGIPSASIREVESAHNSPDGIRKSMRYLSSVLELVIPVIAERLDSIHSSQFGVEFWRRALGMGLDRHLVLTYDHFVIAESVFEESHLGATTLDSSCFHIPVDYDDLQWFLSDREMGQEQLFSLYCAYFHAERFPSYHYAYRSDYILHPYITPPTAHQPAVGILGSWFKDRWFNQLVRRSGNEIQRIGFDRSFAFNTPVDPGKRAYLSEAVPEFDKFTNFFLSTLSSLMPRSFVEEWSQIYHSLKLQMSIYRRLKWVVSELWIGDAIEPIVLAILMQKGIKTIYHEHNYSEHPFVGSAIFRWARLCDIYMANGPHGRLLPNGIEAGSLFDYGEEQPKHRNCTHKITYISGLASWKSPLLSGSVAPIGFGHHFRACMAFKRRFLSQLPKALLACIHYRGYPLVDYARNWRNFRDDSIACEDILLEATRDDLKRSCKDVMRESRLVVVSYLSTPHLESLYMNVPTIVLFPASLDYLEPQFKHFFDLLFASGIAYADPDRAANFLIRIADAPESWWYSPDVQKARKAFLGTAVGQPETTIEFLLKLALESEQGL